MVKPRSLLAALIFLLGLAIGFGAAQRFGTFGDDRARTDGRGAIGVSLLRRVAEGFVASRASAGGDVFYDRPLPYGHWLCRTNAYFVPRKVVTGRLEQPQDRWEDPLVIRVRYGVWRRPLGRDFSDAREKACAKFRDFENTFTTEGGEHDDPERAAFMADAVATAARAPGPLAFPVACRRFDEYGPREEACDGRSILRGVSARRLRHARGVSFKHGETFGESVDELTLSAPPPPQGEAWLVLVVAARQHWGRDSASEGEVRSVEVRVEQMP